MNTLFDAFISYGRADSKAFTTELHTRLVEQGLNVWFDQNDIPLGVDFQNQIDEGIARADNFIFIISPHSVNSAYCRKEIVQALKHNKRIIPIMHVEQISRETWDERNPNRTTEEWKAYKEQGLHTSYQNMHPAIGKINWINFREGIDDFETALANLLNLLRKHSDYVRQHTQFLDKALEWDRHQQRSQYLLIGEDRVQAESWLRVRFKDEQPPCEPTDLHCEFITESTKNAHNLMTQVFLCYATKERGIMEKIAKTLRREGFTIWTNRNDIQTGIRFQDEINEGIEAADNLVYLISPDSIRSKYCQDELEHAFAHNKRIISLLVKPTDLEQIPPKLSALQFIDCTGYQDTQEYRFSPDKLLNALHQDAHYYEQHKTLLVKALKWQRQNRNPSILLRGHYLQQAQAWLKIAKQRTEYLPLPLHEEFIDESSRQPPNTSLEVFISYSRTDSDFARQLNDALQSQGKTTWFDQESIAPGSDFQQEIYRGIESADNFLFVISPSSVNSPYCADEVEYAASLNKRFVTVLHRTVSPKDLHPSLASVQWIDFKKHGGDFYANFSHLIRTLDIDREHVQVHTRLLTRAMEWERQGRDDSFLLRGKDLEASQQWLERWINKEPAPTELQNEYILASRELPFRKPKLRTILWSSVAIAISLMIVRVMGLLQPLELAAYDRLLQLRPSEGKDPRLLIVEVNENDIRAQMSRNESGKGTLSDSSLQKLLEKLQQYQPRVIGLDIFRDFSASQHALATLLRDNNRLVGLCETRYTDENGKPEGGVQPPHEIPRDRVPERVGFSNFLLSNNLALSGDNQVVRRQLLVQPPDPNVCPVRQAFSLAIARRYLEAQGKRYEPVFTADGKSLRDLRFGNTSIRSLGLFAGGYQGNLSAKTTYHTLINYRTDRGDPREFAERVPLEDVLNNWIPPQQVKDRIVLVGITAKSSVNDYALTPYGSMAGVLIQGQMVSQIVSTVLDGRPQIWWWPLWGEALWIWVWSAVGGIIVWHFRYPQQWVVVSLASVVGLAGICYFILASQSGWVPLVPPAIALVITAGSAMYFTFRLRK
ncbi:MAG TPA: TIR domain-containing protein [Allocoleopsis sp.]